MSKILDKSALKGLIKVGNIIIPGSGNLPSYEKSLAIQEVDRMVAYMSSDDRFGLKLLLSVLSFLPNTILGMFIKIVFNHKNHPKLISPFSKMIMLGLKGLVMTTYYTEHDREGVAPILSEIGWSRSSITPVKDKELCDLIQTQDLNSNL